MLRIDAHHHLWRFNADEFGWLEEDLLPLRRDFLVDDLLQEMHKAGVAGTVAVQARQSREETDWLLNVAAETAPILGVVGWLPLRDPVLPSLLEPYATQKKLVGLRHVLQAEPDGFMDDAAFRAGIAALEGSGLVYDILIYPHQMEEAARLVSCFPRQSFVLDHLAKPYIRRGEREPWATHLRKLAAFPNVVCKVSGMVTEAKLQSWTAEELRPYFEIALELFTPSRLMVGTDWPVMLAGCSYKRWWSMVEGWTNTLTVSEQSDILARTAERIYRLSTNSLQQYDLTGVQA